MRERVEQEAKRQKAREAASAQLAQMLLGAPNVDAVAQKVGRTASEVTVDRQGNIAGLTGDTSKFVEAALKGNVGQMNGPVIVGDGAVAFQVIEQKRVTSEELQKNRDGVRGSSARAAGASASLRARRPAPQDRGRADQRHDHASDDDAGPAAGGSVVAGTARDLTEVG